MKNLTYQNPELKLSLEAIIVDCEDRPVLKKKLEEVLNIIDYSVVELSRIHGKVSNVYDDNGKSDTSLFIRSDTVFQDLEINIKLSNGEFWKCHIKQFKSNYKVVTRATYKLEDYGRGNTTGKNNLINAIKNLQDKKDSGINPYQKELDNWNNDLRINTENLDALYAELGVLSKIKEQVPLAFYEIEKELRSYTYKVESSQSRVNSCQAKYDKA